MLSPIILRQRYGQGRAIKLQTSGKHAYIQTFVLLYLSPRRGAIVHTHTNTQNARGGQMSLLTYPPRISLETDYKSAPKYALAAILPVVA